MRQSYLDCHNESAQQSGFVYDDPTAQKSGDEIQDPVVPPEKLYGHPVAGLLCERQFERVLIENGWEQGSKL